MRRLRPLALLPALMLSSAALAQDVEPLTSGEFRNTAQTIEKGKFVLHPLSMPSGYGITDNMDVKFRILGLLGGPNASLEYALAESDGDSVALSIEPTFNSTWDVSSFNVGGMINSTVPVGEANRLNLRAGALYGRVTPLDANGEPLDASEAITSVGIPLALGYDLVLSDRTTWRFTGQVDVLTFQNTPASQLSVTWNRAIPRKFRIALGLGAYVGPNPLTELAEETEVVEYVLPDFLTGDALFLPVPLLELWWAL